MAIGGMPLDFGLAQKLAFVTGTSRGIGRGLSELLAAEGCKAVMLARDPAIVESAAADLREKYGNTVGMAVDLTSKDEVFVAFENIRDEHGDPDILVYNNSGARGCFSYEEKDEDYEHALRILILGFAWCVQNVLPAIREKKWGRIVTMGSICAQEPHRDYAAILHNLGRPAQICMSKTLANKLGECGISVNTIATGTVDHDGGSVRRSWDSARVSSLDDEEIQRRRLRNVPMRRAGTLNEIGSLCAFLCSEQAGYIHDQTISIDGGRVAYLM